MQFKLIPGSKHYYINEIGQYKNGNTGTIGTGCFERGGYKKISLNLNGKRVSRKMHYLVLLTFIGDRPIQDNGIKYVIDHINGIKDDNRLENIRYITASENVKKGYREDGNNPRVGERNSRSILTEEIVRKIRKLATYITHEELSEKFNTSRTNITNIIARRRWSHVL